MTQLARRYKLTEKNFNGRRFKGVTLFAGVRPRDAVGNSRTLEGTERDEILAMSLLLQSEPEASMENIMEIRRINDRIYAITRRGFQAEYIVEELTPFKSPTLDKGQ